MLSIAGKILKTQKPEEVADCLKQCWAKTLKGIILAAEIFDLKEEPTDNGGVRLLYKISPEWELSDHKRTFCDEGCWFNETFQQHWFRCVGNLDS